MPSIETARLWYSDVDPIHGYDHVLRVYHLAERLAVAEGADLDIVRAAALLHDAEGDPGIDPKGMGISIPDENNRPDHHNHSAAIAAHVLTKEGWTSEQIEAVVHCIRAHRFRDELEQPLTLEAKVLFDADKLDAIGAIGVARAIAFAVRAGQPFYVTPSERFSRDERLETGEAHSAYHEYLFKLRKLQERMLTSTGRALAEERHQFMAAFFERLAAEMEAEV